MKRKTNIPCTTENELQKTSDLKQRITHFLIDTE